MHIILQKIIDQFLSSGNKTIPIEELEKSLEPVSKVLGLLESTLECAADAVLTLNEEGKAVVYNRRLMELWNIPEPILNKEKQREIFSFMASQLQSPQQLTNRVQYLCGHPQEKSFDEIELRDGMVFECFSKPQMTQKTVSGRTWIFRNITEYKRAEQILLDSREEYRTLIEDLNVGVCRHTTDIRGKFLKANSAIAKIFGYEDLNEFLRIPVAGIYQDFQEYAGLMEEIKEKGFAKNREVRMKKKDGTLIWGSVTAKPSYSETGEIKWINGIIDDITEQKKMEEANVALRKQIEFILGATKTGLDIIDQDFNIRYVDPEWQKIYGDPAGKKCYEYFMGMKNPCPTCGIPVAFKSKSIAVTEEYLPKEEKYYQVTTNPYQDSKGEWLVAEVNVDITDRKKAEFELQDAHQRILSLIEFLPDATYAVDKEKKVIAWNRAIEELTGVGKKEMIGKNDFAYSAAIFGEKRPTVIDLLFEHNYEIEKKYSLFKRKENTIIAEISVKTLRKRNDVHLWIISSLLFNRQGEIIGAIESIRDITEYKQSEQKIVASLKEKEVLLKEVYHRVKNNMQIIRSILNLQMRFSANPELAVTLKECQNRIHSMALVHEKLYRSISVERINFEDYVKSLINSLMLSYGIDRGLIAVEIQCEPIELSLDMSIPCALIINEILSNALKYAFPDKRKGKIEVIFSALGKKRYRLIIQDDGIGMHDVRDQNAPQTLGMMIIDSFVKQIEGEMKVDSGKGTRYEITFGER